MYVVRYGKSARHRNERPIRNLAVTAILVRIALIPVCRALILHRRFSGGESSQIHQELGVALKKGLW